MAAHRIYWRFSARHGRPPPRLVTIGLYRLSRNPMYVAVLPILVGWATLFESRLLWPYAVFVAIAFHLRVIFGEEPWLARTHAAAWDAYRARVPRWLRVARGHSQKAEADQNP